MHPPDPSDTSAFDAGSLENDMVKARLIFKVFMTRVRQMRVVVQGAWSKLQQIYGKHEGWSRFLYGVTFGQ